MFSSKTHMFIFCDKDNLISKRNDNEGNKIIDKIHAIKA